MRALTLSVWFIAMAKVTSGASDFHGSYALRDAHIHYDVPAVLIGTSDNTRENRQFSSPNDLIIYWSSYPKRRWLHLVPGTGGISIGLAPYVDELKSRHDVSAYEAYYTRLCRSRDEAVKVNELKISGHTWFRVEEYFKTGILARVVYIWPALPDYQIVCRIGRVNDFDPAAPNVEWPGLLPDFELLVKSLRID